ncbi:(2Fe-2S)-binding protein [Janibacter massiliensis]|uniref:(2Fe-2S)-binding protein n=1 Tax=Janibacter massiliensis TaxID=2058291 RepID=UPI000D0E972A|nr:(2Fe-2S)-binding protein [Janibacter massiliensis]
MIVCHCRVVNDQQIRAAVDAGADSLAEVCQRTGAGSECGGCVFAVKAIQCQHEVATVLTGTGIDAGLHREIAHAAH